MVYNPLQKDCISKPACQKQMKMSAVCGSGSAHSVMSSDVRLFLKEADEEDNLSHHCNSLIKSDSVTATPVPLMPHWLLHGFLIRLNCFSLHHAVCRALLGWCRVDA